MKMKTLYPSIIFCLICNLAVAHPVTDMAGRTVQIPEHLERVLPSDVKISVLLFPLLGQQVAACPAVPGKETYRFISDDFMAIPRVDAKSLEAVLEVNPQVVIAGYFGNGSAPQSATKMAERLGIPIVMVDLSLARLADTYRFLGKLAGKEEQANVLADYLDAQYRMVDSLKQYAPKPDGSVYYTLGQSGLMTDPAGSMHTQVFDYLSLENVAAVPIPTGGHAKVNLEQVLSWNPDYIFAADFKGQQSARKTILHSQAWGTVSAVRNANVHTIPSEPFGWFDHPPSVNRVPGMIWLCQIMYHQPSADAQSRIQQFFRLFYNYTLSDDEYRSLFND